MATQTTVVLVDDLNGDPADTTVKFAVDKTEYEIDLSNDNAGQLREAFSRYINAGRKVSSSVGRRDPQAATRGFAGYDPAGVRA